MKLTVGGGHRDRDLIGGRSGGRELQDLCRTGVGGQAGEGEGLHPRDVRDASARRNGQCSRAARRLPDRWSRGLPIERCGSRARPRVDEDVGVYRGHEVAVRRREAGVIAIAEAAVAGVDTTAIAPWTQTHLRSVVRAALAVAASLLIAAAPAVDGAGSSRGSRAVQAADVPRQDETRRPAAPPRIVDGTRIGSTGGTRRSAPPLGWACSWWWSGARRPGLAAGPRGAPPTAERSSATHGRGWRDDAVDGGALEILDVADAVAAAYPHDRHRGSDQVSVAVEPHRPEDAVVESGRD